MSMKMCWLTAVVFAVGCGAAGQALVAGLSGLQTPQRQERMKVWLSANAASIATCFHETANTSGRYDILSENHNSPQSTATARIYWSGLLGSDNYTDVRVDVAGDDRPSMATVTVLHDTGSFSPDSDCRFLRGVLYQ